MKYYVNEKCRVGGDGSAKHPFRTIQQAAEAALPGDEVLVYPGIYREYVNPKHAGRADARIVYRSVEPQGAVITGAEELKGWTHVEGHVWTARVSNGIFGPYNPYTTRVEGDWYIATFVAHTGDVFLNGKSMYEVTDLSGVREPVRSQSSWDPDFSVYTWYAEQDEGSHETVFYANFQGLDPNAENVEISVRENCFYPSAEGIGYITLSGFAVCKAATQWAPPTAYQEGMVGPHWSKGWIIEDCDIAESKCSGISLGKYLQPGDDNKWLREKYKDGTQTERDCILRAQREGWDKEHIGSHIVRRCTIHDCGQTGIVGHLGGVFSLIEDNHIYNINNKQNLAGAEIGGIKMHAAIDVIFRRNRIHHCTRGLWLDWQAQGTRVTQNLFYDNTLPHDFLHNGDFSAVMGAMGEDIWVEVSHGPTLIDNNFLLSERSLKLPTQGIAAVHNLIAGSLVSVGIGTDNGAPNRPSQRYTPYHVPHGTAVAGFMTFLHGDDRFYNNIFVQQPIRPDMQAVMTYMRQHPNMWDDCNIEAGTAPFNGYPTFEEWKAMFEGYCGMGAPDSDRYYSHLPVWTGGNVFLNGAQPCEKEENFVADDSHEVTISVRERVDGVRVDTNLYDVLPAILAGHRAATICTETLGKAFEPEQRFEQPDGTDIIFNEDFFGARRAAAPTPGPVECGEELKETLF